MSRKTPEKTVQDDITDYIDYLEDLGYPIWYERRQPNGFNYKKGVPDLFVVYNGIHIEVEVKQPDGERGPLQEKWEKRCNDKYKCEYICIDSFLEFKKYINLLIYELSEKTKK